MGAGECITPCAGLIELQDKFKEDKLEVRFILKDINLNIKQMKKADEKMHDALKEHMSGEDAHHLTVAGHISATNVHLKNSATKEDLANTNGKIKTMWIIGGILCLGYLAVSGLLMYMVKEDIKNSIVKSSKANYSGLKKVIKAVEK